MRPLSSAEYAEIKKAIRRHPHGALRIMRYGESRTLYSREADGPTYDWEGSPHELVTVVVISTPEEVYRNSAFGCGDRQGRKPERGRVILSNALDNL